MKNYLIKVGKEIANHKLVYFLLFLILSFSAFFRLYRLNTFLGFWYDQGRDALVIWDFIYHGKFFLIGPVTGIEGIFLGPFYYYLLSPFYFLGGGNPVWAAAGLCSIAVGAVFLLFYLGKKFWGYPVGLLAALMSSADSFLNVISISAIRDFAGWKKRYGGRELSAGQQYRLIRLAALVLGLLALVLALLLPEIVNLMVVGIGTIAVFVPATLLALMHHHPATYRKAAAWSIFIGFAVNVIFFAIGLRHPGVIEPKTSFIPAFLMSMFVLGLGMLIQRRQR